MYRPFFSCDDPKGVKEVGSGSRRSFSCVPKKEERGRKGKQGKKFSRSDNGDSCTRRSSSLRRRELYGEAHRLASKSSEQTKEITKDLIKGALNLQDSLSILEQMQASHYASRQHKSNEDENHLKRREQSNPKGVLTRSRSADGGDAIKRCSELDSSSSLRKAPKAEHENPNLIAKLMGLEELPAEQVSVEQARVEKIRTPNSEKREVEGKTLKKVLEIVRSKGLLTASYDRSCEDDDAHTPVVLIKPMLFTPKSSERHSEETKARNLIEKEIRSLDDIEKAGVRARTVPRKRLAYHLEVARRSDREEDAKSKAPHGIKHNQQRWDPKEKQAGKNDNDACAEEKHPSAAPISKQGEKQSEEKEESESPLSTTGSNIKDILVKNLPLLEAGGNKNLQMQEIKGWEAKVVIDYAREFVERKSVSNSEAICMSCEQMIDEICRGVEKLGRISVSAENDDLNARVEGEMRWKCGMWESGRRRGFWSPEMERTVGDVCNLLLIDLIRELISLHNEAYKLL